ncbi:hypothetical protein BJ508DRAFT_169260 [Ascobolus immersus RN42]|uniref:Uncharacterized protein n=1 Tax=Ascobolus immersus RN42 TaxID=1160509 RepID=A0A3N4HUP3_ASCIM|nr:hypothetical protein BJ508DRAFT_169260 [Ascobolus immersus RN42]
MQPRLGRAEQRPTTTHQQWTSTGTHPTCASRNLSHTYVGGSTFIHTPLQPIAYESRDLRQVPILTTDSDRNDPSIPIPPPHRNNSTWRRRQLSTVRDRHRSHRDTSPQQISKPSLSAPTKNGSTIVISSTGIPALSASGKETVRAHLSPSLSPIPLSIHNQG